MKFDWKIMVALIKYIIFIEGRKGPVTERRSFRWVTAQITGCPQGKRGNPQQPGGEQLQRPPITKASTTPQPPPLLRLYQVEFLLDKCSLKMDYSEIKELKGGVGCSLRGDRPHFLRVHSCERNQLYFPLSLFLPQFTRDGNVTQHHATAVSISFISSTSQWDKIFQWQLFCFGFYCGAPWRQDMLRSTLWVASHKPWTSHSSPSRHWKTGVIGWFW